MLQVRCIWVYDGSRMSYKVE